MRPMRAPMSYALQSRSSVIRHCGRGHRAFVLRVSSGWTISEAMAGSTAGICPRPNFCASCIAAKALPSEVGLENALESVQQACSSFTYSSEGGTIKWDAADCLRKKALEGAASAGGTSNFK